LKLQIKHHYGHEQQRKQIRIYGGPSN